MNYQKKYLKYKEKYISIKSQIGGIFKIGDKVRKYDSMVTGTIIEIGEGSDPLITMLGDDGKKYTYHSSHFASLSSEGTALKAERDNESDNIKQEHTTSLVERLAKLATVRADLDSVRQLQEEERRRKKKELSKRKEELDITDAQLNARCEKLEVRCAELDERNAKLDERNVMLIKRFEELSSRKDELFKKEAELVVREKSLSRKEKEVSEAQEEFARRYEALKQLEKSYVRPQPCPKPQSPKNDDIPEYFMDNVFTLDIMVEPVFATDGFTYEKRCILEWFSTKRTSPTTGAVLSSTALIPNHSLKSQINLWREKQARRS
jgi:hypothetical protein